MKIKLQTPEGSFIIDVSEDSTLNDLKQETSKLNPKLNPDKIKILNGYPPKSLNKEDTVKIKDCDINSGDTLIIQIENIRRQVISKKQKNPVFIKEGKIGNSASSQPLETGLMATIQEEICLICEDQSQCMLRIAVPSDNSCLFTCVYFITHCGTLDTQQSNNLRKIIAEAIGNDAEKYNEVYLGRDNADYCQWIMDPNSWGGAIELSIFSDYFKIEITCIDIMSGAVLRFGQDKYLLRGILIYDGIHYDPLVMECSHLRRTIFPAKEEHFLNLAMGIVREARSSRQFTDLKNFKLQCGVCGLQLQGDQEAREHAAATSHDKFGEII